MLQGYFTTCGNLNGDGTFAYRLAGLPLTAQRVVLLTVDHFRKPENRVSRPENCSGKSAVWTGAVVRLSGTASGAHLRTTIRSRYLC